MQYREGEVLSLCPCVVLVSLCVDAAGWAQGRRAELLSVCVGGGGKMSTKNSLLMPGILF